MGGYYDSPPPTCPFGDEDFPDEGNSMGPGSSLWDF